MFNKCPHCGASYMDDDAEICPSCEQPLKGPATAKPKPRPAAKAKPKPAAEKAPAPAKESPKPKAAPSTKVSKDAMVADDDPFDLGAARNKTKAVPVARKPAKGRMVRVECPMCESPGFIAPSQRGKEVRCWNPKCKLPVFTAPVPEEKVEEEPEKKSPAAAIVLGVLLLGAAGGAAYFFMNPPSDPGPAVDPNPTPTLTDDPDAAEPPPEATLIRPDEAVAEAKPLTPDELRSLALRRLAEAARDRDNRNRLDSARLQAEAYALAGDRAKAEDALKRLGDRNAAYTVAPLALLARKTGDAGLLDAALAASERLPNSGRQSLDWATELAVSLVTAGRTDDAAKLIDRRHDDGHRGEYAALRSGAEAFGTYDLLASGAATLIRSASNPQWVAVTRALIAEGAEDEAAAWAKAASGETRDDALTAWAGTVGARKSVAADRIVGLTDNPTVASRMLAAAGFEAMEAGRRAEAEALLAEAVAKYPEYVPEAVPDPSAADIYRSRGRARDGLPDMGAARTEALAALKIAELQSRLGQPDAAWETLQKGLTRLRGAAPSAVVMRRLVDQYETDRRAVESELRSSLELRSNNEVFQAFNRYRRQADAWAAAAERRFGLQERLAGGAIEMGLAERLLPFLDSPEEPWASSATVATLTKSETAAVAEAAKAKAAEELPTGETPWATVIDGEFARGGRAIAGRLKALSRDPDRRGLWTTVAAVKLLEAGRYAEVSELLRGTGDAVIEEDVLEIVGGRATVLGRGEAALKELSDPKYRLSPSGLAAMNRGIVGATPYVPEPEPPPAKGGGA